MRTITEHNEIISVQAANLAGTIINKARTGGGYVAWDMSYWKGYCDALDQSGQLWKETKAIVIPRINNLNNS